MTGWVLYVFILILYVLVFDSFLLIFSTFFGKTNVFFFENTPLMNKENFDNLPADKKLKIENAYFAALNKQITPSDFFAICKETLTSEEFDMLFSKNEKPKEQEEIKTEYLQDILQYSGVDLKQEADQIVKETETHMTYISYEDEDVSNQMYSLLNVALFKDFLQKLAKARGFFIDEEAILLLFQILKRKLLDMIEKMDRASKIRVEHSLSEYVININNDLKRQLWCLEQIEKSEMDKLLVKRTEEDGKKKIKRQVQEREDLIVKKKISNNIAMAALGLQQKSWMSNDEKKVSSNETQFTSLYAPYDEKYVERRINNRAITMKDFLYVLERDKRYNKSIFTIQYYFR